MFGEGIRLEQHLLRPRAAGRQRIVPYASARSPEDLRAKYVTVASINLTSGLVPSVSVLDSAYALHVLRTLGLGSVLGNQRCPHSNLQHTCEGAEWVLTESVVVLG